MNGRTTRIRQIIMGALFGLGALMSLGALTTEMLGIDRTPGFGMIQMGILLAGITFLTLGAFIYLRSQRKNVPRSLQADIGVRLAATGLVFAYVAGLADLLRIGTHPHPDYERPFVGWLQLWGIGVGLVSILIGLLLYYTSRRIQETSSMEFIANSNGGSEVREEAS